MEPLYGYEVTNQYENDFLRLIARSCDSIYAYWEISQRRRFLTTQHFECDFESLSLNLRVYNVTDILFHGDNAHRYLDLPIEHPMNHKFVQHLEDDATFIADIGVFTLQGQFVPLVRSNAVHLPWKSDAKTNGSNLEVVREAQREQVDHRITPFYHENFKPYGLK